MPSLRIFYQRRRYLRRDPEYCGRSNALGEELQGYKLSPAHIVEMDEEMDDAIKALEFAPAESGNAHSINFLPLLIDRTMNTFPAIKNALTEAR